MYTTIELGPQRYTVPHENEAEVRRLLWSQLKVAPANDVGGSELTRAAVQAMSRWGEVTRRGNRVRLRLVVNAGDFFQQFDGNQSISPEPVGPGRARSEQTQRVGQI